MPSYSLSILLDEPNSSGFGIQPVFLVSNPLSRRVAVSSYLASSGPPVLSWGRPGCAPGRLHARSAVSVTPVRRNCPPPRCSSLFASCPVLVKWRTQGIESGHMPSGPHHRVTPLRPPQLQTPRYSDTAVKPHMILSIFEATAKTFPGDSRRGQPGGPRFDGRFPVAVNSDSYQRILPISFDSALLQRKLEADGVWEHWGGRECSVAP